MARRFRNLGYSQDEIKHLDDVPLSIPAYTQAIEGYSSTGYTGSYPGYTGPGMPDITLARSGRIPDTNNYLGVNYFQLEITRTPTVTYFCQTANLPSLTLTPVEQPGTLGVRPKWIGGQYAYEDLQVSFLVDEDMRNWMEVYRWMEEIGNLENNDMVIAEKQTMDFFSDITLLVTNSSYKPQYRVQFKKAFPIAISGIQFNTASMDTEPILATATFTYDSYTIKTLTEN